MTLLAETTLERLGMDNPSSEDRCRPQRVLVVDENELIQAGLRSVLIDAPWVESCLLADSLDVALYVARRCQPQVVIVSMSLGGRSAIHLCRALRLQLPHIKIVLMSGEGRIPAAGALSLGAVAALSKDMPRLAFADAIRRIAEGARIFPNQTERSDTRLSRRESDVLQHLASGLSNPEIAAVLHLSRHTVKQHTSAVYRKLGVRNRAQAASRARELGLLTQDRPHESSAG